MSSERTEAEAGAANEELVNQLRRERADFLNYRKRMTEERASDREGGRADLLTMILPLFDDLDRALAQVPPDLAGNSWVEGIVLTQRRLTRMLEQMGLRRFGSPGDVFDPALHEAVSFTEREGQEMQKVSEISSPGYTLGDRLLRPARVAVHGPLAVAAPNQATTNDGNVGG
jgi:molecular chaperone GrpE